MLIHHHWISHTLRSHSNLSIRTKDDIRFPFCFSFFVYCLKQNILLYKVTQSHIQGHKLCLQHSIELLHFNYFYGSFDLIHTDCDNFLCLSFPINNACRFGLYLYTFHSHINLYTILKNRQIRLCHCKSLSN